MTKSNTPFSESGEQKTYHPADAFKKELIEHLSLEIDTHKKMIFDWRARAAFYWLVGPFVAIGSVVIITKQLPQFSSLGRSGVVAGIVACVCFILMGVLGAKMEAGMWNQCNTWRKTIFLLIEEGSPPILTENNLMEWQRVMAGYLCAHFLLLFVLITTLFLVSRSPSINSNDSHATASPTSAQATAPPKPVKP